MLIALGLVVALGLIGWQFTARGTANSLLLAPAFGLPALLLLAYTISLNFRMSGGSAIGWALAVLLATTTGRLWLAKVKVFPAGYKGGRAAGALLLACIPAFLLLIPAMQQGVENFFGAVNFDFFYNSQDAWFLATHAVLDFDASKTNAILPLDWSANAQGRFAISLIGAFAVRFLDLNPLHFNSSLLSALVIICSLTAYAFAQRVLGLGLWFAGVAAAAFVLSGGFAQGYIYYLLGQISAIPVFILFCIYSHELLLKYDDHSATKRSICVNIAVLVFLLNALYVMYAILSVFASITLLVAAAIQGLKRGEFSLRIFLRGLPVLAWTLGFYVLTRILSLDEAKQTIMGWITLSLKTAGANDKAPAVFSEYITESFFSLFLGVFRYPTNASIFNNMLGIGTVRSGILLAMGTLAFFILLWAFVVFVRKPNQSVATRSMVMAIALISVPAALLFFMTQSGYAIFKIGSWLMPILLMVPVAAIAGQQKLSRWRKAPLLAAVVLLCFSNAATAINYSYAFLPGVSFEKYENSQNVNGMAGIGQLRDWLQQYPERPMVLDLSDGIKTAWFANELRARSVEAFSHNLQPLEDKIVPPQPCGAIPKAFPANSILVTDQSWNASKDIVSIYPERRPDFTGPGYSAYFASDLDHYVFLGRGSYQAYTLPAEQARQIGFPATFRWIERGVEVLVYSARDAHVDIRLTAAPGYVSGPPDRSLHLSGSGVEKSALFNKKDTDIHFDSIAVNKGMSCFFIESTDDTSALPRYGALFRNSVQMDSRYLNFVLGDLQVRFAE